MSFPDTQPFLGNQNFNFCFTSETQNVYSARSPACLLSNTVLSSLQILTHFIFTTAQEVRDCRTMPILQMCKWRLGDVRCLAQDHEAGFERRSTLKSPISTQEGSVHMTLRTLLAREPLCARPLNATLPPVGQE